MAESPTSGGVQPRAGKVGAARSWLKGRSLRWYAAAIALVPFLALVWRFDFVCDDAYISYRYAFNLARGEGLRFNLGPHTPVEGYSEFLWVLVISAGMKLSLAPWVLARLLSVACGALLIVLTTGQIARAASGKRVATLGASLAVGTLAPLAVWSTSGMGTAPFLLAAFGLHVALFGSRPRGLAAALCAVLVVLLRADGAFWVFVSGATGMLLGRDQVRRAAFVASAAGAVVFFLHMGWRVSVYGDWMPNTARVKVGLSAYSAARGASYLGHFLLTFPGVLVALLLVAARARDDQPARFALLASLAYPVLVGGDFMAFGRFVLPALPLACVLLARAVGRMSPFRAAGLTGACVVLNLLPAYDAHAVPEAAREALHVRHNAPEFRSEFEQWHAMKVNAQRWELVGRGLAAYTRPEATVVTGGIGAIGFFSDRFLYDQNGLVTRAIALGPAASERRSPGHDKAVPAHHFLKHAPTFLKVKLWGEGQPLPPDLVPSGEGRDLVRVLEPEHGFPPGYVLLGYRPR